MLNNSKALSLLAALSAALVITGCCSTTTAKSSARSSYGSSSTAKVSKPAPAPAPAKSTPAPAPAPAPARSAGGYGPSHTSFEEGGNKFVRGSMAFPTGLKESSGLLLEKVVPAEVLVGKPFSYEYKVINLTDYTLSDVSVTDRVTDNFRTSDSSPKADAVNGGVASWKVGTLGPRETKTIKVMGSASSEGTVTTCGWATYSPILCEPIKVVKPALELVKTMPAQVTQCDPIPVKLVVKNSGSSRLTAVKVTDTLPSGLTTDAGQSSVSFDAGNLNPGESKEFSFNAKAAKTGKYANPAKATSAQGVDAAAEASVMVVKPVLSIACITPAPKGTILDQQYVEFIGRPFEVCWEVKNTGDSASAATTVSLPVPAGLTFRSATEGGANNAGTVTWNVGSLAAGASKKVCATFSGSTGGTYNFSAAAKGTCAEPVNTACSVFIQGINAILVEVVDDPDPIEVGGTTTYKVEVTNQGGGLDLLDVSIKATFPDELEPQAPSNGGVVSGKSVTWPTVANLPLKAKLSYTVKGKGLKAGDARLKVDVTTKARQTPIVELESTTVY
jgi:uncharacterized repeat protein (TIGR01451 family)